VSSEDARLKVEYERTFFCLWRHEDGRTATVGVYHHRTSPEALVREVIKHPGGARANVLGMRFAPKERKKITATLDELSAGLRDNGFVFEGGETRT
jgi:hypothetical protein